MSAAGLGIAVGVEVAGVLRPDDQVGSRRAARPDGGGQREGGVDVVAQHGGALGEGGQPQARHVALDQRDAGGGPVGGRRHGERPAEDRQRQHRSPATPRRDGRGTSAASSDAEQGDGEGHQRHAAEGGQRREERVGRAGREPAPGEPAEGQPVAQRLLADPQRGGPDRPARQSAGERERRAERRQEGGLQHREGDPGRRPGDGAGPVQQRQEQREPGDEAGEGGPPQRRAPDGERERGDAEHRCGRERDRRERRGEQQPGDRRRQQSPGVPTLPALPRPARARPAPRGRTGRSSPVQSACSPGGPPRRGHGTLPGRAGGPSVRRGGGRVLPSRRCLGGRRTRRRAARYRRRSASCQAAPDLRG